jgi:hypothetical protein
MAWRGMWRGVAWRGVAWRGVACVVSQLDVPIVAVFGLVNTKHATLYTSEPLAAPMQLCGVPNVRVTVYRA